jgi:hypothetical protein
MHSESGKRYASQGQEKDVTQSHKKRTSHELRVRKEICTQSHEKGYALRVRKDMNSDSEKKTYARTTFLKPPSSY